MDLVMQKGEELGVKVVVSDHWASGGAGAEDLAREVVKLADQGNDAFKMVYEDDTPLWEKIEKLATTVYSASAVSAPDRVKAQIRSLQDKGYGSYPICVAKTQYSFSTDPTALGAPEGHTLEVREVRLAAGAEFIVVVCGDIMTMPGLPKVPAADGIDVSENGQIVGLF